MTLEKVASISATALATFLMAASVNAHDGKYVTDGYGNAVKDGYGKCVKAIYGNMPEGCEAAPPPPVVKPPIVRPPVIRPPVVRPKVCTSVPIYKNVTSCTSVPINKVVTLGADTLFAFDKSNLSSQGKAALDGFIGSLGGVSVTGIAVAGHTDSIGTNSYNQKLSVRRANTVAKYLVSNGVAPESLQVGGFGESKPVATNRTGAGRQQNRRVDLHLKGSASGGSKKNCTTKKVQSGSRQVCK